MPEISPYTNKFNRIDKCQVCFTKLIDSAQLGDKNTMNLIRHVCLIENCSTPVMCGECFDKHKKEVHP